MAHGWSVVFHLGLDVILTMSIPFYLLVLWVIIKKKPFSYTFTALTVSLGAIDITGALFGRVTLLFPTQNWFRHFYLEMVSRTGAWLLAGGHGTIWFLQPFATTLIAIDRFWAVVYPMSYGTLFCRRVTQWSLAAMWTSTLPLMAIYYFDPSLTSEYYRSVGNGTDQMIITTTPNTGYVLMGLHVIICVLVMFSNMTLYCLAAYALRPSANILWTDQNNFKVQRMLTAYGFFVFVSFVVYTFMILLVLGGVILRNDFAFYFAGNVYLADALFAASQDMVSLVNPYFLFVFSTNLRQKAREMLFPKKVQPAAPQRRTAW